MQTEGRNNNLGAEPDFENNAVDNFINNYKSGPHL